MKAKKKKKKKQKKIRGRKEENEEDKKGKKRKVDEGGREKEEKKKEENESGEEDEGFPIDSEEFKRIRVYLDVIRLLDKFSIEKRFSHCIALLKEGSNSIQGACYHLLMLEDSLEHIVEIQEYKKTLVDFLVKEYVNFDKRWKEKEFVLLPNIALKGIFQSDNLNVSCEETVLKALRRWIKRNPKKRVHYLAELLPLVRFTQIEFRYLTDYVLGYNNFFDLRNLKDTPHQQQFQNYLFGALRFHSFKGLRDRKTGCFSNQDFPDEWLKGRAGYNIDETSELVDWECDLAKDRQFSRFLYFRGVFYRFSVEIFGSGDHYFCVIPDRSLTSGEDDPRLTNVEIKASLLAFNYQTNARDFLKRGRLMSSVDSGSKLENVLKIQENSSPYIKVSGSKKMVHLFAFFKKNLDSLIVPMD